MGALLPVTLVPPLNWATILTAILFRQGYGAIRWTLYGGKAMVTNQFILGPKHFAIKLFQLIVKAKGNLWLVWAFLHFILILYEKWSLGKGVWIPCVYVLSGQNSIWLCSRHFISVASDHSFYTKTAKRVYTMRTHRGGGENKYRFCRDPNMILISIIPHCLISYTTLK